MLGNPRREAQGIDGVKVIGGAIVVFGWMYVHWVGMGRGSHAMVVAPAAGLSPYRIARPYNRWGVDTRCDIWTLCGAFVGLLLGLGIGWWLFDSLPVGILFGSAGALIAGSRERGEGHADHGWSARGVAVSACSRVANSFTRVILPPETVNTQVSARSSKLRPLPFPRPPHVSGTTT